MKGVPTLADGRIEDEERVLEPFKEESALQIPALANTISICPGEIASWRHLLDEHGCDR